MSLGTKKRKIEDDEIWRKSAPNFAFLLRNMFEREIHVDITVKVESENGSSKEIDCHTLVLAAHSPVLSTLLSARWNGINKKDKNVVILKDDDPHHFYYFVKMMYWDWNEVHDGYEIPEDLTPEITVGVLSLAHKYLAFHVVQHAERLIDSFMFKRSITDTAKIYTSLGQLAICERGEIARKTFRKVENCVLTDGEKLFSSDAVLLLNQDDLECILPHYHLRCVERIIYNGCLKWAQEQCKMKGLTVNGKNMRSVIGDDVFKLIRFPLLGNDMITTEVIPENILREEEAINLLVYLVNNKSGTEFYTRLRASENVCLIRRLEGKFASNLVDFSAPHGFTMSLSKELTLYALDFFGGESTFKNYKYHVELKFLDQLYTFKKEVKGFKNECNNIPRVVVKVEPEVVIPPNVPIQILFTVTGGRTYVSDEVVDEITKEITYTEDESVFITFKSSSKISNGLKQIPRLCFCTFKVEDESESDSSDSMDS